MPTYHMVRRAKPRRRNMAGQIRRGRGKTKVGMRSGIFVPRGGKLVTRFPRLKRKRRSTSLTRKRRTSHSHRKSPKRVRAGKKAAATRRRRKLTRGQRALLSRGPTTRKSNPRRRRRSRGRRRNYSLVKMNPRRRRRSRGRRHGRTHFRRRRNHGFSRRRNPVRDLLSMGTWGAALGILGGFAVAFSVGKQVGSLLGYAPNANPLQRGLGGVGTALVATYGVSALVSKFYKPEAGSMILHGGLAATLLLLWSAFSPSSRTSVIPLEEGLLAASLPTTAPAAVTTAAAQTAAAGVSNYYAKLGNYYSPKGMGALPLAQGQAGKNQLPLAQGQQASGRRYFGKTQGF